MLAKSESFAGEWPIGLHWQPGEVREVASLDGAPEGIVPVTPPPAKPAKSKPMEAPA